MEVLMLRREEDGFPPTIFSCFAILSQFGSLIEIEIETYPICCNFTYFHFALLNCLLDSCNFRNNKFGSYVMISVHSSCS